MLLNSFRYHSADAIEKLFRNREKPVMHSDAIINTHTLRRGRYQARVGPHARGLVAFLYFSIPAFRESRQVDSVSVYGNLARFALIQSWMPSTARKAAFFH